jgi:hypothetical protein
MVSLMTGAPRASRFREIFRTLQEDQPGPDPDVRIELCRKALGLMSPGERSSDAGGWLEFEIGKAFLRRQGPDRVSGSRHGDRRVHGRARRRSASR